MRRRGGQVCSGNADTLLHLPEVVVAVSYGGLIVSRIRCSRSRMVWDRVQNLDRSALPRPAPTLARLRVVDLDRILCQNLLEPYD